MKTLKKVTFGAASTLLTVPALAFAQFETPAGTNLPGGTITNIITSLMRWLLMIVGILGVIGFVIAGIIYLTAAGDTSQIDRGKKTMVYSIIGILVALIGLVIIQAVRSLLTGTSQNF